MNGTPWKGSIRGLSQKAEIFTVKTPVETPGSKVLDGESVIHKVGTITWKVASINPRKHMESLYPIIERHNFLGLETGSRAKEGADPSPGLIVSWYLPSEDWFAKS